MMMMMIITIIIIIIIIIIINTIIDIISSINSIVTMALTLSVFDFLPKVDDANDASFFSFAACNCSSAKPSVNRDDRSEFKAFNLPIST
jgi:hypothetical protein